MFLVLACRATKQRTEHWGDDIKTKITRTLFLNNCILGYNLQHHAKN